MNIDNITRLSGRVPLGDADETSKACVEFSLKGTPRETFREQLLAVCADLDIDAAVQEDGIYRRNRRLIAFDMDTFQVWRPSEFLYMDDDQFYDVIKEVL